MIKAENIYKTYYQNKHEVIALKDINLTIETGEWLTILGPSGSGKSTLLNIIGGIDSPSTGFISVDKQDINKLSDKEKRRYRRETIGYIFQDFRLLPQYSVLENTMLPLIPYKNNDELKKRARDLLDDFGMGHRTQHSPEQLSGGEKQRTAIARALINDPPILLCDEPTGNLDVENRDIILNILKELSHKGKTIILVTHDHELAKTGHKSYNLRAGEILQQERF